VADHRVKIEPTLYIQRQTGQQVRLMQVIGERSSGTNYTHKLCRRSLEIERVADLGWKHAFPHVPYIRRDMLVICVVRNAIDWLISMHKRPWHSTADLQALPFADFIRSPWTTEVGGGGFMNTEKRADVADLPLQFDRHPITGEVFQNLVQLRNCKLAALIGMRNRVENLVLVQFETILADPGAFILQVRESFGLTGKDEFDVGEARLGAKFRADVPDRPAAPATLSPEDLRFLLEQLDLGQEARVGYSYTG
jgi:hypothetical protein